ncbi:MAG: helix-hairpin-helix domain-containing protein [Polyangiaceae bacterium]
MQNTSQVSRALREIAALLEFSRAPSVKAYPRAVEVVDSVGDLAPLVEQGRLEDLAGIGATLSRHIEELWNTGSSQFLSRLRSEQSKGASELVQLEGMTPRRLRALVDALGVHSVAELRSACADERVQPRRGGLCRSEVLNALSAERFAALVRPRQVG